MSLALQDDARPAVEASHVDAVETVRIEQSLLRFITCGSVDDGKSTLIGRLLFDSKSVFEDQLEALDRDSRRFGAQGKPLDLALLVDGLSAEREQGITIDVAYRYFATPRRAFIVADTPGHEQYTRNMATGASTAELAIILIDARKGILPQTRRHSFIVSMLGVRCVAVAVNKMDLVDYDRATFERICSVYRGVAADLGFDDIAFFPISALNGDNVARLSHAMPWYKGRSLLDHLETVQIAGSQGSTELLFPVQWVNRPSHDFRGYSGVLARGTVRAGDEVVALPKRSRARIERIITADGDLETAVEGQAVTLTLDREFDISRGDVLVSADSQTTAKREALAHILWTGEKPLAPEEPYLIKVGTALAQARVAVQHTIDIHSFAPLPVTELAMNGIALARVTFDRDIVSLPYAETRELGGFILIDKQSNDTVAFGLIERDPAGGPDAVEREPAWRRAGHRIVAYFYGPPVQEEGPQERSASFLSTALLSTLLVLILTGSALTAAMFAVLNTVLIPLVRILSRKLVAHARSRADELNSDGAGI